MADEKSTTFRIQFLETMATLITAGFGLVAALAWNEAIKKLIEKYFPNDLGGEVVSLFIYAILVTVIVVVASIAVARSLGKLKEADKKMTEKYSKDKSE